MLTHHEQGSDSPVETSTSGQAQQHQSLLPSGYPNFMFPQVPNGTFITFQVPNFNLIHREIGCWSKCNRFSVGGSRKISSASDWGKGLAHFANPILYFYYVYIWLREQYSHLDTLVWVLKQAGESHAPLNFRIRPLNSRHLPLDGRTTFLMINNHDLILISLILASIMFWSMIFSHTIRPKYLYRHYSLPDHHCIAEQYLVTLKHP